LQHIGKAPLYCFKGEGKRDRIEQRSEKKGKRRIERRAEQRIE